jgi:hypothetical protein
MENPVRLIMGRDPDPQIYYESAIIRNTDLLAPYFL